MKMKLISLLLIFKYLLKITYSQIIIDFEKKYKTFTKENFTKYISQNEFISKLIIGTPKQEIPLTISFRDHLFYISHKNISGIFNEKLSSSYKKITNIDKRIYIRNIKESSIINDNIYLNDKTGKIININSSKIIFITNVSNISLIKESLIGLTQNYNYLFNFQEYNFIFQLKKNNFIKSYSFYYDYNDNSKGKIIFGEFPHEINNKKYNLNNLKYYHYKYEGEIFIWEILFNSIKFSDKELKDIKVIINNDFLGIFATFDYIEYIKENFFNEYLNNNLCSIEKNDLNDDYSFIICDEKIDIKKFEDIKFYNRELNYTFILNYNDIFIKKENKYYCLILFEKKNKRFSWYIGEVLLKKYILIFNELKVNFGFYINFNKNYFFNFSISWILVIIFFFSTIILFYILLYKLIIKRKRRIRANELEDNVDYISKEDYKSINKIKL